MQVTGGTAFVGEQARLDETGNRPSAWNQKK